MLVAEIAQLRETKDRRRVGARHQRKVENDIGDPTGWQGLDVAAHALEHALGRTEKDVSRKPVQLDGVAALAQMPCRFGRSIDVARKLGARDMPAYRADPRVADRKTNAGTDNAAEHADEIAILNADDRNADRQQHVEPGPLDVWAPQRVSGEGVAEIKDETGRDGNGYQAGQIKVSHRNCAEDQRC